MNNEFASFRPLGLSRRNDGHRLQVGMYHCGVRYVPIMSIRSYSGTNAVRYGTAKGEWFLNAVGSSFLLWPIGKHSSCCCFRSDRCPSEWRCHQNPATVKVKQ